MTLVDDKVDVDPAQPFLGFQLHDTIRTSLFESETRAVLLQRFKDTSGFHLVDVRIAREANATVVRAVIRGPKAP